MRSGKSDGMTIGSAAGTSLRSVPSAIGDPSPELHEQVHDALHGHGRHRRVDAALEPPRRLRAQLVAPRRARHRHGVEVGALDQQVRGRGRHLGRRAAHDAREAEHAARALTARGVRDEQVLGVERAVLVVERRQALLRLGPAHDDGAGDLGRVVGVERLAELEHHVVGDVDGERDGAHARLGRAASASTRGSARRGRRPARAARRTGRSPRGRGWARRRPPRPGTRPWSPAPP